MMNQDGYRENVGIVLVNSDNVFGGEELQDFFWQMPQGGTEQGETLREPCSENSVRKLVCNQIMFVLFIEQMTGSIIVTISCKEHQWKKICGPKTNLVLA